MSSGAIGYVSASLLVARLQAGAHQHPLAKALIEYGKLQHTNHALRWLTDQGFRRRIGRQLNRGESLNALRRYRFNPRRHKIVWTVEDGTPVCIEIRSGPQRFERRNRHTRSSTLAAV